MTATHSRATAYSPGKPDSGSDSLRSRTELFEGPKCKHANPPSLQPFDKS